MQQDKEARIYGMLLRIRASGRVRRGDPSETRRSARPTQMWDFFTHSYINVAFFPSNPLDDEAVFF